MTLPAEQGFSPAGALNDTDSRLIMELVAGIDPTLEVLARYGLSMEDLKRKLKDPGFRNSYHQLKADWGTNKNMRARIRLKAGIFLEDTLQDIFRIIKNEGISAQHRTEAFKQLSNVAGTTADPKAGSDGNQFSVTIITGESADKQVQISAAPRRAALEHEPA